MQLLNDFDQGTARTIQVDSETGSATVLLDRFGTNANKQAPQNLDEHSNWLQWIENETKQRLLSACFMFDVHQAMYHQQSRFKAPMDDSRFLLCLPAQDHVWNANNASEWMVQRSDHQIQPLHLFEQELSTQGILKTSSFAQSLLICWLASSFPSREDSTYRNDFLPYSKHPSIEKFVTLFPNSLQAHTYLALYHTPLHDLLAIAGDTWVFAQKITPPSAFRAAQFRLKIWSTSLAAAQATHHACRVLSESLTPQWTPAADDGLNTPHCISDYWSIYVSALICWAFGHRYQNPSNAGGGTLSRTSSSTAIGGMAVDEPTISGTAQLKAVRYANEILELNIEELLTSKAAVKCDTTGVIDAVQQRLELESVGNKSGLLVDAVTVLTKIKEGGRTKDGGRTEWF
jgi:Fungal specific transcription factor domain